MRTSIVLILTMIICFVSLASAQVFGTSEDCFLPLDTEKYSKYHDVPCNLYPSDDTEDCIINPPKRWEFSSHNGKYIFVLSTPDKWQSMQAFGELFEVTEDKRDSLWNKRLPQWFGPRYILVGNQGQVFLIGQWTNIVSDTDEIVLLNKNNDTVIRHGYSAVKKILGVSGSELSRAGKNGSWLSSPPTICSNESFENQQVKIKAGGKILTISVNDGSFTVKEK